MLFRIVFWIVLGAGDARASSSTASGRSSSRSAPRRGQSRHQGRPRDARDHAQQPGRRRAPGGAGRHRLRDRRRHHRRADADRRGVEFRRASCWTVGANSLFLSLFLTMIVCLVLGMGIPTIPNYIITSAIAAPALLKLGVPLIVSHMFVFYFGIMADLTPPVALAAFAAASIAKASPMRIGWKATHIAIAGFVIPYMAVYDPALMLQPAASGIARSLAVVYVVFKTVVAIGLWGAARSATCAARSTGPSASSRSSPRPCSSSAMPWTDEADSSRAAVHRVASVAHARRAARKPGIARRRRRRCAASACSSPASLRATLPADRIHARVAAFGREDALGRALSRRRRPPAARRGAHRGHRRRHGAAAGRDAAARRLVDLAPAVAPLAELRLTHSTFTPRLHAVLATRAAARCGRARIDLQASRARRVVERRASALRPAQRRRAMSIRPRPAGPAAAARALDRAHVQREARRACGRGR